MVIYVKNNFNTANNNKNLSVLRRWEKSLYWMTIMPGESTPPIELPGLDDNIEVTIHPASPMRECTLQSRVTYDECMDERVEITPPSMMIDYPYSVEVEGKRRKVSIATGRHDWKVDIIHPEKEVDRWTPGMEPGTYPEELTVVVGDDIDT